MLAGARGGDFCPHSTCAEGLCGDWTPADYQQQAATKSASLTPQQALQIFQQSANEEQQLPVDFQLRPQAVYFLTNTAQLKSLDASKAPIRISDLLVTSDVPGVAMKSIPVEFAGRKLHMPGTIIGKALEPLEKGKGEILVLLSLQ